ncbi:hypothetical protein K438DRAFT_1777605 [Mycena galopus ATCC 62051]|nr:hypothetical protein K438DRAFT_1777605 [Mycena galopus ATCC 62051]
MVPRSAYGRGHAPRADQPGLEGAEEDGGGDADEHAPERGKSGRRDEDVEANQGVGGTEDEAEAFTALDCIEDGPTVTAKDELKAGTQHAVQFRGHTASFRFVINNASMSESVTKDRRRISSKFSEQFVFGWVLVSPHKPKTKQKKHEGFSACLISLAVLPQFNGTNPSAYGTVPKNDGAEINEE